MSCAVIASVEKGAIADELGLMAGDRIVKINKKDIIDLIQFRYEWAGEEVELEIEKNSGERQIVEIEKDYDDSPGIVFESAVFDGVKRCQNRCLFCFVDQMPPGMRGSLYIKDDDYRLSFLQGSYITMTNLSECDIQRIKKEHLSPLYLSVHATEPALRTRMLNNPRAGDLIKTLADLTQAGIEFHTQIVLCPGINDGENLARTYRDLLELPGILSIAVVPVGLTRYRDGLPEIQSVDGRQAGRLIDWVEARQGECKRDRGTNFIWPSDEFYFLAKRELPPLEVYEDFCQLENGVGQVRLLWDEFEKLELPVGLKPSSEVYIATGVSGRPVMLPLVRRIIEETGLKVNLRTIANSFFGPTVTVTGLLTGKCLLKGLKGIDVGSTVIIPEVMLEERKGKFLDDQEPEDVAGELGIKLVTVPVCAQEIVNVLRYI